MSTTAATNYRRFDAVIFDLFGVLIAFDDDLVTRRLAEHCADPRRAFAAMQDIVSREDLIRGRLTLNDLHADLVSRHGLSLSPEAFKASWLEPYSEPMPGMGNLIRELVKQHRLVLLSNVDKYYWNTIRDGYGELQHFDRLVLSCDVGVAKPDRAMFELAVQAAGTDASRCFFVDDKLENVQAAARLGLRAHRFIGVPDLLEALSREYII